MVRILMAVACVVAAQGGYAGSLLDFRAFYVVPGVAFYALSEGQSLKGGTGVSLTLGYDVNEPFAVEASAGHAALDRRGGHGTATFVPVAVDGLYHFTRMDRFDPVLFVGLGLNHCNRSVFNGKQVTFAVRAGGGFFYHLSDTFALRCTVAAYRPGDRAALSATASAGIAVYF